MTIEEKLELEQRKTEEILKVLSDEDVDFNTAIDIVERLREDIKKAKWRFLAETRAADVFKTYKSRILGREAENAAKVDEHLG